MVTANDPLESLLKSIQSVKEAFSPLELSFQKAARDFECCFGGAKAKGNSVELGGAEFGGGDRNRKTHIFGLRKRTNSECVSVVGEEKKKGLSVKIPIKVLFGKFSPNSGYTNRADVRKNGQKQRDSDSNSDSAKEDNSCVNCLQFALAWSFWVNSFTQAIPAPFKTSKKRFQSQTVSEADKLESRIVKESPSKEVTHRDGKYEPLECFIGFVFDKLTLNLQKLEESVQEGDKIVKGILDGGRADVNVFLGNLRFAKVGGVPSGVVGVASSVDDEDGGESVNAENGDEAGGISPQKLASGLLSIPLSNVERLRSTLSTVSLTELIELVPHLGRPSNTKDYPDKKKLFSVQDFFRYTESEGTFSLTLYIFYYCGYVV